MHRIDPGLVTAWRQSGGAEYESMPIIRRAFRLMNVRPILVRGRVCRKAVIDEQLQFYVGRRMGFVYRPTAHRFVIRQVDNAAQIRIRSRKEETDRDRRDQQRLKHRFRDEQIDQFCAGVAVHAEDEWKVYKLTQPSQPGIHATEKGAAVLPSLPFGTNSASLSHALGNFDSIARLNYGIRRLSFFDRAQLVFGGRQETVGIAARDFHYCIFGSRSATGG